jgi:hypothetical protein
MLADRKLTVRVACFIAFVVALLAPLHQAIASCPEPIFTAPQNVRLNADAVLIVTHASSTFDARLASKRGIDEAMRFAKNQRMPIVVLQDGSPVEFYFMEDCNPDYRVASTGGEIPFNVAPSHVYVVGGHLELCLGRTVNDILFQWSRQPSRSGRNLTVTYLMDGIYANGKGIEEDDRFYKSFTQFMSIVTWGRPAGEHWPKLTLLETMGVIGDRSQQFEFLQRILPRFDRTLPNAYRVELHFNHEPARILRQASGLLPPTLRFEFFSSVLELDQFMQ